MGHKVTYVLHHNNTCANNVELHQNFVLHVTLFIKAHPKEQQKLQNEMQSAGKD